MLAPSTKEVAATKDCGASSITEAWALSRNVHGLFGIVLDVTEIVSVANVMSSASLEGVPFLLSTPNLNFLNLSRRDAAFRRYMLESDLCPADGMALVWLARLIGIPLPSRVAGSDLFDFLKSRGTNQPIRVFLFGGTEDLVQQVAAKINQQSGGLVCVGALAPGFGSIDEMSSDAIIKTINASCADFLAVFLPAKKGQEWLVRNYSRLNVAVRAALGTTLNFQAGKIRRSPPFLQRIGAEWLWRIREEPHLWRRYLHDGLALIGLLLVQTVPYLILRRIITLSMKPTIFSCTLADRRDGSTIEVRGCAVAENIPAVRTISETALARSGNVILDLSATTAIDTRFIGLVIMLRKILNRHGRSIEVVGSPRLIRWLLKANGFGDLLG